MIADELLELGYLELFQRLDDDALERVWRRAGSRGLRGIVEDGRAPVGARFLAAEVLFARDPAFPRGVDPDRLAEVYAGALAQDAAGMANPWGTPGRLDGPVAEHAVSLGAPAVPAFARLLDHPAPVTYGGSEDATAAETYRFRVKDLAASVIAAVLGADLKTPTDPVARDAEIERLRRRVDHSEEDPHA